MKRVITNSHQEIPDRYGPDDMVPKDRIMKIQVCMHCGSGVAIGHMIQHVHTGTCIAASNRRAMAEGGWRRVFGTGHTAAWHRARGHETEQVFIGFNGFPGFGFSPSIVWFYREVVKKAESCGNPVTV